MALNVTTAVFRPGFNIATASPSLVQWDQGQTLQFEGVELPSAYQVEFTNAVTVQAITMIGNENGVEIPNELLQQSFPINAYIVLHETAEDRETEYWATIYVKARQQPREETPDPEQSSVIDQTIAALQEGVAEAQAASQAVQNMGVEAETLPEGSAATVEKTVDPETGEVTLGFGIPEGRHGATGATPDIRIGTVTTGAPGSQADASITGTREEPRLNLTIPQGPQGDAGVTSVNGKTGAVTLNATDVGAKPASYEAPVSSVNGRTGAVVLDASDVGAKPASYEAPVSSVNEKTGAVVLDSEDIRYDSTETYSDGTVGKELGTINSALSSLSSVTEIIDTASGAIASFPDGAGLPMRSLLAQIEPVQDLHGYDTPWPAGGGANKLNANYTEKFTTSKDFPVSLPSGTQVWVYKDSFSYTVEPSSGVKRPHAVFYDGNTIVGAVWVNPDGKTSQVTLSGDATTLRIFANGFDWTTSQGVEVTIEGLEISYTEPTAWTPYSNLCPISGWQGLSGQRTGVNLFDAETELGGRGAVEQSDGSWYIAELTTITPGTIVWDCPSGYTGQFTISYLYKNVNGSGSQGGRFKWVYSDGTSSTIYANVTTEYAQITNTSTSGKTVVGLAWDFGSSVNSTWFKDFQVELSSTASPYEPYTGEAISVSFGTTVYGGQDEIVSGQGMDEWTKLKLLSSFAWQIDGTTGNDKRFGFPYASNPSIVKAINQNSTYISNVLAPNNIGLNSHDFGTFYISNSWIVVHDKNSHFETLADFKAWLDSEDVYLVYKVATPTTFTHEGQEVDTLVGRNNVWVDTGAVAVEYPADTKLYIDKKIAEALA